MKVFYRLMGMILIAAATAIMLSGCERSPAKGKLQIMYSGNLRGNYKPCGCHVPKGGLARWAAFVKRHGDPEASWLTVDAGNFVDRSGIGGCSNKCQFIIGSYGDLRYDVLNLGKQEVWMGYETLQTILDSARTTFVSANVLDRHSGKPLAEPYIVKDFGNLRVGVIGLLNEADFPSGSALLDTAHLSVTPAVEAAQRYIPALAKRVDAVVLLADLPTHILDSLLKIVPAVDLVISSGALRTSETATMIGKTWVLGSGSSGYNGHYATLEFDPSWGDSVAFSSFQDVLTDVYDEPGIWSERIAAFESSASPALQSKTPAAGARSLAPDQKQHPDIVNTKKQQG
ncbi:MAG: hypothetical protein ACOZB3_01695 [Calditrichota bacterium]